MTEQFQTQNQSLKEIAERIIYVLSFYFYEEDIKAEVKEKSEDRIEIDIKSNFALYWKYFWNFEIYLTELGFKTVELSKKELKGKGVSKFDKKMAKDNIYIEIIYYEIFDTEENQYLYLIRKIRIERVK